MTRDFVRDLDSLELQDCGRVINTFRKLFENPDQGSLQTKRMKGADCWEVRVNLDLRLIVEFLSGNTICRLVDHHDAALRDAEGLEATPRSVAENLRTDFAALAPLILVSASADDSMASGLLAHLSDAELQSRFGVPESWLNTVRLFNDGDALLGSGIDVDIGVDNAFNLADEFGKGKSRLVDSAKPAPKVVYDDLGAACASRLSAAKNIQNLVIIAPSLEYVVRSASLAVVLDYLRDYHPPTLLVLRQPTAPADHKALKQLAAIRSNDVMINDGVLSTVISCVAPKPWGFAAVGFSLPGPSTTEKFGLFFDSANGEDIVIRGLADVGLNDLRVRLSTRRYGE